MFETSALISAAILIAIMAVASLSALHERAGPLGSVLGAAAYGAIISVLIWGA